MLKALILLIFAILCGFGPANAALWSCDFNSGATGWQLPQSGRTSWRCVQAAGYADFTGIDANDSGSLSVEGTESPADREISYALSPLIRMDGAHAVSFYVGWSSSADATASLELLLTDAAGNDSEVLWSTLKADTDGGEWAWRRQTVILANSLSGDYRLKFRYTSGTLDAAFGIGGYRSRFFIDNIELSEGTDPVPDPEPTPEPLRIDPECGLRTASNSELFVPPMSPVVMHCTGGPEDARPAWTAGSDDTVTASADGHTAKFIFASEGARTVRVSTGNESAETAVYAGWRSVVSVCPPRVFGGTYTTAPGEFSIAQEYGKPAAPVAIDRVDVWLQSLEAEPGATVTVGIDGSRTAVSTVGTDGYKTHDDSGNTIPLTVSFPTPVVVDRPFRITVSAGTDVRLTAACDPTEAGGAYVLQGAEWKLIEGKSLRFNPHCAYSSIVRLWPSGTDDLEVPAAGGTVRAGVFSHLSLSGTSDQPWCRLAEESESNGEHILTATCEPLPTRVHTRRAVLSLTDGASTLEIGVVQGSAAGIEAPKHDDTPYTVTGRTVSLPAGSSLRVLRPDGTDTGLRPGLSRTLAPGVYIITGTDSAGRPFASKLRL